MDARDDMRRLAEPVTLPPWGPELAQTVPSVSGIQMLRLCDVVLRVGYGKTEIYRRIANEGFPAPVPIAEGRRAWVRHEVEAWIAARADSANHVGPHETESP